MRAQLVVQRQPVGLLVEDVVELAVCALPQQVGVVAGDQAAGVTARRHRRYEIR